jgi:methyl-accepting chemotaxis protein
MATEQSDIQAQLRGIIERATEAAKWAEDYHAKTSAHDTAGRLQETARALREQSRELNQVHRDLHTLAQIVQQLASRG